jgi:hypothetical protein
MTFPGEEVSLLEKCSKTNGLKYDGDTIKNARNSSDKTEKNLIGVFIVSPLSSPLPSQMMVDVLELVFFAVGSPNFTLVRMGWLKRRFSAIMALCVFLAVWDGCAVTNFNDEGLSVAGHVNSHGIRKDFTYVS